MTWNNWLPLLIVLSSMIPGLIIFFLHEKAETTRTLLNLIGATVKLALIGVMLYGVWQGEIFEIRIPLLLDIDLVLHGDAMSLLFATLSTVLWYVTTIYAISYMEPGENRSRFFGFFSLCVSASVSIALAGNLVTFLLFYELLTLSTYPLVVHYGSPEALRAGRVYLAYTLAGGTLFLAGVAWLRALVGPLDFTATGLLADIGGHHPAELTAVFALLVTGLGVKAALVPLHGWLPRAMVAPAPVSALLHAVAVVKAGAFGILRVVYDVYGIEFASNLDVLTPLAIAASVTIIYGSLRALFQDELKKRLAYSTVSQVSYIILGAAVVGPLATIGGTAHMIHQGLMKITLFFCAGILIKSLGVHHISEMHGAGRRLPWTMLAFTVGALGMIGIPPLAGFISKWYLGTGAIEAGQPWVVGVLLTSTLLNALYFLPILYVVWFRQRTGPWPAELDTGGAETRLPLLLPTLFTALLALVVGLLANMPFSPLQWARLIASREYLIWEP